MHKITAAARAASEHNLSARVTPTGPRDELRELAETFDEMLERLQAAFEAQEQFIANASHELRTPLAVMRTTVDVVLGNSESTPAGKLRLAVRLGDARRLDVGDDSVDAVLLMGPLYHLIERAERAGALAEALRVLRPGGVPVGTAIGRFAWLFDVVVRDLIRSPRVIESVAASVATGLSTQRLGRSTPTSTAPTNSPKRSPPPGIPTSRSSPSRGRAISSKTFESVSRR